MIPVYDKGDYVLRVEPPPGWTFEPESVDLHIDGKTDPCSKTEDLNFKFTGFGVVGKVKSRFSETGPAGVTLTLKKASTKEVVKQTMTVAGGDYTFEKVLPGDYTVEGSHPVWKFEKPISQVAVGRETGKTREDVTVHGFDVRGRVLGEGEPVQGVNFLLFSDDVHPDMVDMCSKEYFNNLPMEIPYQPHCHAKSDEQGNFVFEALPCGTYKVIPFYTGETINFDVVPAEVAFKVNHDSVEIKEPFQVTGFSVDGRVMNAKNGHGVPNAEVLMDGKPVAKSDIKDQYESILVEKPTREGWYTLKNIKTGSYVLQFRHPDYFFNSTTIKVSPNTPRLPEIYAARFSVCGQVIIDKIPDGLSHLSKHRTISFRVKGQGEEVKTTKTEEDDGRFCADLAPGEYIVKVALSEQEVQAGLKLAPASRSIQVKDSPIKDLKFTQFRAQVGGRILCLESCGPLQLTLSAAGRPEDRQTVLSQTFTDGSSFTFHNVMPGKYKVTIQKDEWCWKKISQEIDVTDHDLTKLVFSQTGYILSCSLSHDITLNFAQENKEGNVGSFDLTKGVNKFCLSQPGVYKLSPVSCHQFEHDTYQYDTSNPRVLSLTAVSHKVEGSIISEDKVQDITITVSSSIDGSKPVTLGPLKYDSPAVDTKESQTLDKQGKPVAPPQPTGPYTYRFHHWAKDGEKLTFTPTSKTILFYPSSMVASVHGDSCPGEIVKLEGKKGVFIIGKITPKLADVQITIDPQDESESKIEIATDSEGSYKVGPLHSHKQYTISAQKEGYVMTEGDTRGNFNAFKLAEINVKVLDASAETLSGVLLSLSGGSAYRSNKLTAADGSMQFIGLGPGQYYLRPMMKEYQFDPASQMIEVTEGATLDVSIKGTRVAFSCYGTVTSLNGEPEQEVYVQAVGQGSAECRVLEEDTKTEHDGSFRIRGLQPQCDYVVRLPTGEVNQHIERAAPQTRKIKVDEGDVADIHIIAFRRMNQLDLSGNVITASEHLPSLKVHLFRESNLDAPLHSTSLGTISFFYLPSLKIDHEEYVLRLESSLSKLSYDHAPQEVFFTANTTYKHFTLSFEPKKKSVDQELSQGSILALPLTILAVYIAYNYKTIVPTMLQNISTLKAMINNKSSHVHVESTPAQSVPSPIEIEFVQKKQRLRKV